MATLVAKTAVNMNNLTELGLLSNLSQLKTPSITDVSSFTATKGSTSMLLTGSHMTAVLKVPKGGTLDGVNVSVNGQLKYAVNNLGMPFSKMQKNFSGDFGSKIFSGADVITGSNGNDTLLGYQAGDDISGKGGNDTVRGGIGNDDINGGGANDTIFGDNGNDVLDGGAGVDTLTGGAGQDAFLFDDQLNGKNIDTVTDFTIGTDVFQLDNSSFPGIGGRGNLPSKKFVLSTDYSGQDDVVVYFKSPGKLAYEVNGGGLGDAIQFAKVTANLNLSANDFVIV